MPETNYELFRQPPDAYRGKPFWSWNGKLEREELLRQVRIFREMGFGGFFMHSRTGLQTEYLGEEWLELIRLCAEEAEKLGLEAWLYDEDRWPSGTASGLVTTEPRFRLKFVRLRVVPAASFEWSAGTVAAFVCRLEGLACYDCERIREGGKPAAADPDRSVLVFTVEEQVRESFYNGYTYVDTMNREAIERYLELTHEKYKIACGDQFGKAIKGIFTDEPHRGALMDGFSLRNEEAHWLAPWTYGLFERFRERYGYDLVERLPELFLQPEGRAVSPVKWHYVNLLQELFHDAFARPVHEWCERNGLMLTGHTLHEDSLSAQTAMVGSVMRFYEHMDFPGVDVLAEGNRNYWIVKQLSSVARQTGRKWLLSELYGCTGWQMPFEGHKAVGDWQALFGINLRCHHLSWYSMEGESKRDFPASIFYQSAWWRDYAAVETYFSRLGVVLTQGEPVCSLLVVHPIESVWCQVHPGWSRNLNAESEAVKRLEAHYRDAFHWLAGGQVDFDYGDEEMMSRLCSIEPDERGGARLRVGQAVYEAVLVTGMTTIRASTLRLLERFREAGGRVIVAGAAPAYVDACPSDEGERLAEASMRIPFGREELLAAVADAAGPPVELRDAATGLPLDDLYVQIRCDGDEMYVVAMNVNRSEWRRNVRVRVRMEWALVEEWFCATGERGVVPAVADVGATSFSFVADFPPAGEHVYRIRRLRPADRADALPPVRRFAAGSSAALAGTFAYRLDEPNVCVLDRAAYRLSGEPWSEPADILQADRAVRDKLGLPHRSGEMIQPWFREKYQADAGERTAPLELRFVFAIETMPADAVFLALERPERWEVRLNGRALSGDEREGWWIDPCFVKLRIPAAALRMGTNELSLRTDFHSGVDLEAVYLLGSFGVRADGSACALTALPERLAAADITGQGLPFYGGTVTYEIDPDALREGRRRCSERGPEEKWMLALPSFEAAVVRVRQGGRQTLLGWQPYEAELTEEEGGVEIDLVLTRRNTFGPLHQTPLHASHYGPPNWVTEGEQFSDGYVLLPSGLLEAPRVMKSRPLSVC